MKSFFDTHPFWARLLFAFALVLAASFAHAQGAAAPQNSNYQPATQNYFQTNYGTANASIAVTTNNVACWGFYLPYPITTSTVSYVVNTADNTANVYDFAILDVSGNRLTHTGPLAGTVLFAATGATSQAWASTAILAPGRYYIAMTSSAGAPLAKFSGTITPSFQGTNNACGTSSSGTIPLVATVAADAWISIAVPSLVLR